MNYTENYHLPQWEKSDRIMMDDFNRMCADMEAGLDNVQAYAADAVAKAQAISSSNTAQAQATADKALAVANNAYCPEKLPFTAGTYVGNGETTTVTVGFRPSFVIVAGPGQYTGYGITGMCMTGYGAAAPATLAITDAGFTVKTLKSASSLSTGMEETHPFTNTAGVRFAFIAFR